MGIEHIWDGIVVTGVTRQHSDQHLGKEIFVFFDPELIYTLTGTADLLVLTTDGSEYSHRRA